MKLHPVNGVCPVVDGHDRSGPGPRAHEQLRREIPAAENEGMIPGPAKPPGHSSEEDPAGVLHLHGLAVYGSLGPSHSGAVEVSDQLMPEAHPQEGTLGMPPVQ